MPAVSLGDLEAEMRPFQLEIFERIHVPSRRLKPDLRLAVFFHHTQPVGAHAAIGIDGKVPTSNKRITASLAKRRPGERAGERQPGENSLHSRSLVQTLAALA